MEGVSAAECGDASSDLDAFKKQMQSEFDAQRAALMQMFVAKEEELKIEQEKNFALLKQIEEFIGPAGLDLDESMRNAQKQTVLLRSVVKPMEDEIDVYKKRIEELESVLDSLRADCDKKRQNEKEELSKQLNEAAAETRSLAAKIETNEGLLLEMSVQLSGSDAAFRSELEKLNHQLARVEWQNRQLTEDNDRLLAKHVSRMEQRIKTESEPLPDVFEKAARMVEHDEALSTAFHNLQFEYLKLHEKMIESMVTWENAEGKLRAELLFLQEQQDEVQKERRSYEDTVNDELERKNLEVQRLRACEQELATTKVRAAELEVMEPLKHKFERENHELRCKVLALQRDLDNSEAVQKDFVKLSQSLQVELEKLRVCDGEVRFQHPDDVTECNSCKKHLSGKKPNCSHCGRIFCPTCVSKTIQSGPNRRSFNVCAVCHTLLDQKSAPYFSTQ
ncbi:rab GTPase-binding effector protein 1 [Galendromus occidentalis]|uniref:Rab GTPase-binding effector protein 1 n=1 Tax=Galendromus occidentalis TaxID=34638 RepID=A0AAJ6QWG3_9ACAR|nr:rab GTPase-binding effector protein 1 [Galendromus occidentalis]